MVAEAPVGAGMTEPASVTAMRQLVAEARLRRTRLPRSGTGRAAVQEAADAGQHQAEHHLADADA